MLNEITEEMRKKELAGVPKKYFHVQVRVRMCVLVCVCVRVCVGV